jgi:hypothetical protein
MDGVPCQSSFSRVTGVSDDIKVKISGSSKGHTRSAQQQEKKG